MAIKIEQTIPLTRSLARTWAGVQAIIVGGVETLVVKRINSTSVRSLQLRLKEVGKKIRLQDIDAAVRAARK